MKVEYAYDFCRAMLCMNAAYAVERFPSVCPSVCLSRSCILSKRVNISFHHQVATPFWFFRTERFSNIATGNAVTGPKIAIFDQCLALRSVTARAS